MPPGSPNLDVMHGQFAPNQFSNVTDVGRLARAVFPPDTMACTQSVIGQKEGTACPPPGHWTDTVVTITFLFFSFRRTDSNAPTLKRQVKTIVPPL
mmetsp:Transcript_138142/g.240161  ORF Transcript_138142/g.240161 Transcript_138142/m.240161 type:complete len:96 (-) Transcript_138142:269-556(-)